MFFWIFSWPSGLSMRSSVGGARVEARRDGVDGGVPGRQLQRQAAREGQQPALGGVVGGVFRAGRHLVHRGDVDDLAAGLAASHELAAAEERAVEIDLDHPVEVRRRRLRERGLLDVGGPGVVDQDVGRAQRLGDAVEQGGHRRLVGLVQAGDEGPATAGLDLAPGLGRAGLVVQIGDGDVRALARQFLGDPLADAGIRTGDDRDPAVELSHGAFLFWWCAGQRAARRPGSRTFAPPRSFEETSASRGIACPDPSARRP
jgi:hypothetical protein